MSAADPASLDNLYDIVPAPAVPFSPPAPGWYIVAGTFLAAMLWAAWTVWRRWHASAYRRTALSELEILEVRAARPEPAGSRSRGNRGAAQADGFGRFSSRRGRLPER